MQAELSGLDEKERELLETLDEERLPRHVAVIMDGNGRWAKRRYKDRLFGHESARGTVKRVIKTCSELGIGYLTLFTFSSENWKRPALEVEGLMRLLVSTLRQERDELHSNGVRVKHVGRRDRLPSYVLETLDDVMELTGNNGGLVLTLAIDYGGRQEIVEAARSIARDAAAGRLDPDELDEEAFASRLWTADVPDPDLLIRTAGEYRVSNFLLWQMAYTEFYIVPTLWPDFSRRELLEALVEYQRRDRRFGGVNDTA